MQIAQCKADLIIPVERVERKLMMIINIVIIIIRGGFIFKFRVKTSDIP